MYHDQGKQNICEVNPLWATVWSTVRNAFPGEAERILVHEREEVEEYGPGARECGLSSSK